MKINREYLQNTLSSVMAGTATKEVIEQTMHFIFSEGKVFTYNDEIAINCHLALDVKGAVPAKEFITLISKMKSEELDITMSTGEIKIKGGKAKAGLRLESEILIPIDDMDIPTKWRKMPADFEKAVRMCLPSVSKDQTKPVLTCISIDDVDMISSDNQRLTAYTMDSGLFKEPVLIPADAAKALLTNKPIKCGLSKGWLHFKNKDDLVFSCRYLDEVFPDVSRLITEEGITITFPKNLPEILDKANTVMEGVLVKITLKDNTITINSTGAVGWFEESAKTKYTEKAISFEIGSDHLAQMIKGDVDVLLTKNTLEFSTEDFIHVVLVHPSK